jgi:dTDP-4-dehydrorhamnose 3,5-epimerase
VTFRETALKGAFTIDLDRIVDERGFFARSWCVKEFEANGLETRLVQCNVSFNKLRGTLRGMHYQVAPAAEVKIVRCTQGAIHDVIADLRPESPTYKRTFSILLSAENRRMLYIPKYVAHGFLTLTDDAEVLYQMSEYHVPQCARGFRWNDANFEISWPDQVRVISEKDRGYPDFTG